MVTQEEFTAFTQFAQRKLSNGGIESFDQLLRQWYEAQETAEVLQGVRDGEAEFAAGGGRPAREVISEIRNKLSAM